MDKVEICGFNISSNTTKVLYTAEELGVDYKYIDLDFSKGEHKSEAHMKRHPLGKTPTLTHNGRHLFESGAICRYLANVKRTALYPDDAYGRALVDQWMDFFTCHLGRHFSSYAFETVAKKKFGFGEPNEAAAKEALGFIEQQLPVVDRVLASRPYLADKSLTIADHFAFAYGENAEMAELPMDSYPAYAKWYASMKARPAIQRAQKVLGRA